MIRARDFPACRFPSVSDAVILCAGVWIEEDAAWIEAARPFVTEEEISHARRFTHTMDAIRHLIGRALVRRTLRAALGQELPAGFSHTRWGKPFCPSAAIFFSIAHSGNMVWTAFCRSAEVGIDVEETRDIPDIPGLAARLHPEENAAIRALPPEERHTAFYRCWTRKEAVLKATGKGLSLPLDSFQVHTGPGEADWIISVPEDGVPGRATPAAQAYGTCTGERHAPAWTSRDIAVGAGYHCSVAADAPLLELDVHLL